MYKRGKGIEGSGGLVQGNPRAFPKRRVMMFDGQASLAHIDRLHLGPGDKFVPIIHALQVDAKGCKCQGLSGADRRKGV